MFTFNHIAIYLITLTFILVWVFTNPSSESSKEKSILFIKKLILQDKSHTGMYVLLTLILEVMGSKFLQIPTAFQTNLLGYLGLFIAFLGLFICIWAKFEMKENWGEPATFKATRQKLLVTTGPFVFSRNPIYLGILLMLLGAGIAMYTYFVLLVIGMYLHFNEIIKLEEKTLSKHFKIDFEKYKLTTNRFLSFPKK